MQRRSNWRQTPLPTARRPSRANGGAPVPDTMVALLFRYLLTSVRPTPVPPMSHPVHLYRPFHLYVPYSQLPASIPVHKSQFFPEQQYDTIKSSRPIRPSRADGGAPVPLPANVRPSQPRPTNVPSIPSLPSSPSVCPLQSMTSKHPSA